MYYFEKKKFQKEKAEFYEARKSYPHISDDNALWRIWKNSSLSLIDEYKYVAVYRSNYADIFIEVANTLEDLKKYPRCKLVDLVVDGKLVNATMDTATSIEISEEKE